MVVIVDYDAGNLRSVQRACAEVGITASISADPDEVRKADKVIFPGVGSAESAVDTLAARGLDQALIEFYATGKPLLGICLGLQILLQKTEEGNRECLGIAEGQCRRFVASNAAMKIPQIGWNDIDIVRTHPMLAKTQTGDEFYFVHSYHASLENPEIVCATTTYGDTTFASIIARDNFFATQFHLEKSGRLGLTLLSQFQQWDGQSC